VLNNVLKTVGYGSKEKVHDAPRSKRLMFGSGSLRRSMGVYIESSQKTKRVQPHFMQGRRKAHSRGKPAIG
jgi:hypothetical protein